MSNIYCVVLREPPDEAVDVIDRDYAGAHYKISDTVYLIDTDETARELAIDLGVRPGVKGEAPAVGGVVFSLNGSYSGFTSEQLWAWLDSHAVA